MVAARTGVSVANLQAANPEAAARENEWLLVGEILYIPAELADSPKIHKVQAGESWNSIAAEYNVSISLLRAVNPQAIRPSYILFRGDELIIPPVGASPAQPTAVPTATATATTGEATPEATEEITVEATPEAEASATVTATEEATEEATAGATVEASATVTVEATVEATAAITDTGTMTSTAEVTESATVTTTEASVEVAEFDLPTCPERFADYAPTMSELSNVIEDQGLEAVVAFLTICEALVDDGVEMADLNGDGVDDLVVVYQNPSEDQIFVEGDLVILNSTPSGYVLGYRARAAGEVRLLTVADVNLDELADVVWVDTTCGASTCFDTVNVRSWDGTSWADWTDGTITMAYAEIALTDVSEEGTGEEITLEGGIYGSVGAGPQRSRSEVWASVEGGPYSLVAKSYSQTSCLYHTVLDANRAFLDAPSTGFEAAVALYTEAVEDESLIECWVRNDELAELRSFSLFRLAVIAGYGGDGVNAAAQIAELTAQFPGSIYDEVGQLWLASYEEGGDAAIACEAVTAFAEEDSASWEMLADYGYTNPSFEAVDVCPVLELPASE
jgi:LysM repeat protein